MPYEKYKSTIYDVNRGNVKPLISANHAGKPVMSHLLATFEKWQTSKLKSQKF